MTLEVAVEYALSKDEEPDAPQRSSANELPLALTHREREVAELVAHGLTNRQIAEELFVSERTVDNHAANILKKLKVRSREQVAPGWPNDGRTVRTCARQTLRSLPFDRTPQSGN